MKEQIARHRETAERWRTDRTPEALSAYIDSRNNLLQAVILLLYLRRVQFRAKEESPDA